MIEFLPKQTAELAFFALDHAIASIQPHGPLIPFVLVEQEGKRTLHRCVADTLEAGLAQAKQLAKSQLDACDRLVIAFDGFVTSEGVRTDAIYVQVFERAAEQGVQLLQRYKPTGLLKKNKRIGNPMMAGMVPLD
jgi:hypothetical protein